jgi:hypothetical protein
LALGLAVLWTLAAGQGLLADLPLGHRLTVAAPLVTAFLIGATFWACRARLPLRALPGPMLVATAAIAWQLLEMEGLSSLLLAVGMGYGALTIGYAARVPQLPHDISYGVYLYGWPVAQALVALFGPLSPLALAALSLVAVLPVALLSWLAIERPALRWAPRRRTLVAV